MPGLTGLATGGARFDKAMKTFYLDPLNDNVYRKTVLLDRLTKSAKEVSGNVAYVPLISGRNAAVGSRADQTGASATTAGPRLPPAGHQTYNNATFRMAFHYGQGQVSGPAMRQSRDKAGAFVQALDAEIKGLADSLPEDLNRQLWNYGHGRAATLLGGTSQTASTAIEVSSVSIFQAKIGDRVHFNDITAGAGITPATGTTIVGINRDQDSAAAASTTKHTIILAATSGTSLTDADDAMYFGGGETIVLAGSSYAQSMFGIPAAIDDGNIGADETVIAEVAEILGASLNYGLIARSASNFWCSQVLKNTAAAGTNRALTNTILQHAWLTAINVGGANVGSIEAYTNPGLWATIGLLHIGDRRYNDYQATVEGGWEYIKYNGIKIFYDRDAPRDIIWFLDMSKILLLTQGGYQFLDDDGSKIRNVSGYDAWAFALVRDCQLGLTNGKAHVRLDDITSSMYVEANL